MELQKLYDADYEYISVFLLKPEMISLLYQTVKRSSIFMTME